MHRARPALALLLLAVCGGPILAHTDVTSEDVWQVVTTGEPALILDVREYSEFCSSPFHIENAINLPWTSAVLQARVGELPKHALIIVVCRSGNRSNQAANFLDGQGFTNVQDMLGGMLGWTFPIEVCDGELQMDKRETAVEVDWTPVPGPQDWDLLRGNVDDLLATPTHVDLGPTECLLEGSPHTSLIDADPGVPGVPYFYLRRQVGGDWGESSGQLDRLSSPDCN